MNFLQPIHIVMVETTLPANIGSAARAMHTATLDKLILVNPKHPIDDTSISHAKRGVSILERAQSVATLHEALADKQLVIAASSRTRHVPRPVITPDDLCLIIEQFVRAHGIPSSPSVLTEGARIALVFGREDRGLTNAELALADYHVQIPANPNYPVLNVAASIQVLASTLYHHYYNQHHSPHHVQTYSDTQNLLTVRSDWDEPAISHAEQQALSAAMMQLFTKLSLADPSTPKDLPKRLSRLTARLQLDQKEYALLRVLIAKLDSRLPK